MIQIRLIIGRKKIRDVILPDKSSVCVYNYDIGNKTDCEKDESGKPCIITNWIKQACVNGKYSQEINNKVTVRYKNGKISEIKHSKDIEVIIENDDSI